MNKILYFEGGQASVQYFISYSFLFCKFILHTQYILQSSTSLDCLNKDFFFCRIWALHLQQILILSSLQVIFLDDIGANLKPAQKMGMTTILVKDADSALKQLQDLTGVQVSSPYLGFGMSSFFDLIWICFSIFATGLLQISKSREQTFKAFFKAKIGRPTIFFFRHEFHRLGIMEQLQSVLVHFIDLENEVNNQSDQSCLKTVSRFVL